MIVTSINSDKQMKASIQWYIKITTMRGLIAIPLRLNAVFDDVYKIKKKK